MKYITVKSFLISLLLINSFSCLKKDENKFNKEEARLIDSIRKYDSNNPDKVISFIHEFLRQNKREDYKKFLYGGLANNYRIKNNKDSTLYYLQKGLSICKESIDIINYKYEIGIFYEERYNYEDASLMYKQCYDLAKKENSLEELKKIEHSLKLLKNKVLQSDEALLFLEEDYNKQKDKVTEITDKNVRFIRKDLIEALISRQQIDKALLLIDEGIEEAIKRDNTEFLFLLFKLKTEAYIEKEELERAIKTSDKAIVYSEQLQNQKFIDQANYVLAKIKLKLNEPEQAIFLTQNILSNKEDKTAEQLSNYYNILAISYEQIDSISLSIEYHKKYKSLNKIVTRKRIALVNDIDKIGLDEAILERKKQESKTMYWNIAFVVLFLFGLILFIRNRKVQKNNQKKFDDLMLKIVASEANNKALNTSIENKTDVVETNNKPIKEEATIAIVNDKLIKDEKVEEILLKIKKLEEKHYFLRQDCTVHNMAKKLKTNTTYLSKIFNNHLGKTFSAYLNDKRINYIIIELKNNKRIRAYSTKAISEDLGYKTVDSFSKYFKQATGITPSVYIKKLQKEA